MDKKKTALLITFLILIVSSVAAMEIRFTDRSFLERNQITITDHEKHFVVNVTNDTPIILPAGKSYFVDYYPRGILDLATETPTSFMWLAGLITFAKDHAAGITVLLVMVMLVIMGARKR